MNWNKAKVLLKEGLPMTRKCWGDGFCMYLEDGYRIRFRMESGNGWITAPIEWRLIRPYLCSNWEVFIG